MDDPIIIAGTYRGGTSMTAGIFHCCGAWMGRSLPANKFNPKGYFENEGLRSLLHTMLQVSGFNDSDNLPPEDLIETRSADRLKHILDGLMVADGYRGGPIALKNPKIPFFWRYFAEIYPNAKWVVVRRDPEAVIASMRRVNVLTLPPAKLPFTVNDLRAVVRGYNQRLDSLTRQLPPDQVAQLRAEEIADGKLERLRSDVEWTGLRFDETAVREFIEPSYLKPVRAAASGK